MKITGIEPIVVHISAYTNWIFVRVSTDEGLVGTGEATLDGKEGEVVRCLAQLGETLVGEDALRLDLLPRTQRPALPLAAAVSGVDIALWDLRGQFEGKPVCRLLSETPRPTVPMYATFNRALKRREPEDFGEMADRLVRRGGYRAVKCAPFDRYLSGSNPDPECLEKGIARATAVRAAIGSDTGLMVDCHWRFDPEDAGRAADGLRDLNLSWLEAPVPERDAGPVRRAKEAAGVPLAGFELQTDPEQADPLLAADALDVFMPDVKYIGGITGLTAVNKRILAAGKKIAPHNMTGPAATLASLHASAAFSNLVHLEYHFDEAPYIPDLSDFRMELRGGSCTVPDRPGLGITLNLKECGKHPYEKTVPFRENMLGA